MTLVPQGYVKYTQKAVAHYWSTLLRQGRRQRVGKNADHGSRAAVTGGKQMDGFCDLVRWLLLANGMPEATIYMRSPLEIPGYFRPTKKWDMLIIHNSNLVAAIEFKSHVGPSFGNNFNNRAEEALGNATDLWTAYREGAFGSKQPRPWLGWVMLLEDCQKSHIPVTVAEPHFQVFPEFRETSYAQRYELMLRKLVLEKLYDGAAFIMSKRTGGKRGTYSEPTPDLSIRKFLAGLGGHVRTYLESQ